MANAYGRGIGQLVARLFVLVLSSALPCCGTRVEDLVLFDGQLFTGWVSIARADGSRSSPTVPLTSMVMVEGRLSVDLPDGPTPDQTELFRVEYWSQRVTSGETWSVPRSGSPLKRANIIVAVLDNNRGGLSRSALIPQRGVNVLPPELKLRPTQGPEFGTGAVAFINGNGQIETVVGNLGDCVMADGTTGECVRPSAFADGETPTGVVDGTNATFTLLDQPDGSSLMLFRNGMYMKAGLDYSLSDQTITFVTGAVPQVNDILVASYRISNTSRSISTKSVRRVDATEMTLLCEASGTPARSSWMPGSVADCSISMNVLGVGDGLRISFTIDGTPNGRIRATLGLNGQIGWTGESEISEPDAPQRREVDMPALGLSSGILHLRLSVNPISTRNQKVSITAMQVRRIPPSSAVGRVEKPTDGK